MKKLNEVISPRRVRFGEVVRGIAFAAVVSLGVSSCATADLSAEAPADEPTQVASADPIIIGLSVSETGPLQKTGVEVLNGYRLWAETVNASGGLLGRQVELKVYDDQSDPAIGLRLYQQLVTEDKVDLVLGPFSSAVTSPVAAYLDGEGFPLLTGGASAAEIWTNGYTNVFGVYASGAAQNRELFSIAQTLGAETMYIVNEASPFGQDTASSAETLAEEYDIEVLGREEFPPNSTDFGGLASKLGQIEADFLLAGTYYDQATLLATALASANVQFPLFAETIGPESQDFVDAVGEASDGILGVAHWAPGLQLEGSLEFEEAYLANFGKTPIYQAAMAYSAGQVLQAAVEEAGTIDHDALRGVLQSFTTPTISGEHRVDETGFQVGKRPFITQVQNGKPVVVGPENAAASKPVRMG